MNERRALTYLGIIIAIDTALWNLIEPKWWFILIDVGLLICCILISKIEYKFNNSHHEWIDRMFYVIAKNENDYKILQKTVDYSIISPTEAEFYACSTIKVTKASNEFKFVARYQWEQDEEIDFKLKDAEDYTYHRTEECNWTSVQIFPKNGVSRKEELKIGFNLKNLKIRNLVRHSFLSHKVSTKVKKLKLIVHVDSALNPQTADFVVKNVNNVEIKREPIPYNKNTQTFEKNVFYPRKGRTYIIQWGYDKEETKSA